MTTIDIYKKMYSKEGESDSVIVEPTGSVTLPNWLRIYLIHSSGVKTKKKRLLKKVLKKQLIKIIKNYAEQQNNI